MSKINVLDQNTINQIAAGEVIDRPASVVKELVENAIDAGATAVTIELKEGGLSLIRITDNGSGIDEDDVHKAFMPHATSKIKDAADLVSISSLGFRGEALSSIAAVCQVELISKTRDSLTGYSFKIEGGQEGPIEEIGAPDGTTFLVKNIFFNTPARRKFLKSPQSEGLFILELAEHMALSVPQVAFRVIINGQTKLSTSGNGKLRDVIYAIYGKEIATNLLPINSKRGGLTVTGFIGKPSINRANRAMENYFVNGRYVKAKLIQRAVEDAYKPYMMQHKYPFCVLDIHMPADLLDVNVHPAKMELRFRQEETLYNELYQQITEVLQKRELIAEAPLTDVNRTKKTAETPTQYGKPAETVTTAKTVAPVSAPVKKPETPEPFERTRLAAEKPQAVMPVTIEKAAPLPTNSVEKPEVPERIPGRLKPLVDLHPQKTVKEEETPVSPIEAASVTPAAPTASVVNDMPEATNVSQPDLFDDILLSKKARSRHRLIGQLFKTYLLIEYDDKFYMIDQHAAHEKVLFEQTMKKLKDKECTSKALVTPIMLHLSERQKLTLEDTLATFEKLGFVIEEFGGNTYCLRAIPDNMLGLNQTDLFYEMLDELTVEYKNSTPETILDKVASMSCKAAVKGNMSMTEAEANYLIDELLTLDNPYFCPHGRPTIISMTKTEIEKKFKRIV